jgi:hypothetical protein
MKALASFISTILLLCLVCLAGCDTCEKRAGSDFQNENPGYTILDVQGDGNDTTVMTYVIKYKKPGDDREYVAGWAYETKNGQCSFVSKTKY